MDLKRDFPHRTALNQMESAAWVINLLRQSTIRMKRMGESGSPCPRPLVAKNVTLGLPFTKIEKFVDDLNPLIHLLHRSPKPFASRISFRKSQSTLSNAFSISSFMTITLVTKKIHMILSQVGGHHGFNSFPLSTLRFYWIQWSLGQSMVVHHYSFIIYSSLCALYIPSVKGFHLFSRIGKIQNEELPLKCSNFLRRI